MSPIFNFSTLLLSLTLLSSTSALFFSVYSRPEATYSTLKKCPVPGDESKLPQNGIYLHPKPNEVWKLKDTKRITFCSGRFHEESSVFYDYLITKEDIDVFYIAKPQPGKKASDFNATLPILDANSQTNGYENGTYTLIIQEKHSSYGGAADASTVTFIPIKVEV